MSSVKITKRAQKHNNNNRRTTVERQQRRQREVGTRKTENQRLQTRRALRPRSAFFRGLLNVVCNEKDMRHVSVCVCRGMPNKPAGVCVCVRVSI